MEAGQRSAGGEVDWPQVVVVKVVRKDGFDQVGLADRLERRDEVEEKEDIKGAA